MGDLFLLGAGFSKAISASMPLLADLNTAIQKRSGKRPGDSVPDRNFELWLTHLSQGAPWLDEAQFLRNRADFIELSRVIADEIEHQMREAAASLGSGVPPWLHGLIESWHQDHTPLVTMNYDTLIERIATPFQPKTGPRITIPLGDFYPIRLTPAYGNTHSWSPQRFRLYKLHGSTNWYYSGTDTFYGETIYFVPAMGLTHGDLPETARFIRGKIPLTIPPVIDKGSYFRHESLRTLWQGAHKDWCSADRIFCLGYSLPVSDLTMRFFMHSRPSSKRVPFYIANKDSEIEHHFRELLPGNFDIKPAYTGDNAIPEFCNALFTNSLPS
jgi:hypothetical protein